MAIQKINSDLSVSGNVTANTGNFTTIPSFGISSTASTTSGLWNPIYSAIAAGTPLYFDEEFGLGNNSVTVYNNSGGTGMAMTRVSDASTPNSTGYKLVFSYTTGQATSPGLGGFQLAIMAAANKTFVQRFRAKLPVGYNFAYASNSMGTGSNEYFITGTAGTGKWEEYIRVVKCGNGGTFSSGGHLYVAGSLSASITFELASCNVYEVNTNSNLTFNTPITGLAVGANTALASTDTLLAAIGKLQGQLNSKLASNGTATSANGLKGYTNLNALLFDWTGSRLNLKIDNTVFTSLPIDISGNASTATTANSWGNKYAQFDTAAVTVGALAVFDDAASGQGRYAQAPAIRTWLGLDSAAYQPSTAFFPRIGNIPLNATTDDLNGAGKVYNATNVPNPYGSFLSYGIGAYSTQFNGSQVKDGPIAVRVNGDGGYGSWYNIYHTGNFNPTDYLPRTGGGMTGTITGAHITALGTANTYSTGGFETRGNGTTNTIFPSYGFHQPNMFGGTIQLRDGNNFHFLDINGANKININAANANFYGTLFAQASTHYTYPTLGVGSGQFQMKSNNNLYGFMASIWNDGNVWMQVGRTDGTATAYSLILQPAGGNVGIGTSTPSEKLHVVGNGLFSGSVYATGFYGTVRSQSESQFWNSGTSYADPRSGFAHAIKIGSGGMAVNGDSYFNQNIYAGRVIASGTGNDYNGGAFEVKGNGSTIYPSIGFHQPGLHAASIQLPIANEFWFYTQGRAATASIVAGNIVAQGTVRGANVQVPTARPATVAAGSLWIA